MKNKKIEQDGRDLMEIEKTENLPALDSKGVNSAKGGDSAGLKYAEWPLGNVIDTAQMLALKQGLISAEDKVWLWSIQGEGTDPVKLKVVFLNLVGQKFTVEM